MLLITAAVTALICENSGFLLRKETTWWGCQLAENAVKEITWKQSLTKN